jgi:hypothetical protein
MDLLHGVLHVAMKYAGVVRACSQMQQYCLCGGRGWLRRSYLLFRCHWYGAERLRTLIFLSGGFAMRKMVFAIGLCLSILLIGMTATAAEFDVLILVADSSAQVEADAVMSYGKIGGDTFNFTQVNIATGGTRPIADSVILADEVNAGNLDFSDYNIIWLPWNGPGHDSDYFMEGVEDDILSFVEQGGVVYMAAFDDNYTDANGSQIGGWMPIDQHPATVSNTGDSELTLTAEGEATGIFDGVDLSGLVLDDNFANTDPAYTILAVRDDNGEPASIQLDYGAGAYLEVCTDARSTFPAAEPMVGNILAYAASIVSAVTPVEPADKLPATWGDVKSGY